MNTLIHPVLSRIQMLSKITYEIAIVCWISFQLSSYDFNMIVFWHSTEETDSAAAASKLSEEMFFRKYFVVNV